MHARIQQLAEQAGYKPLPGFDLANTIEETYLEKFAQLIVQRCAEVAWRNTPETEELDYSHLISNKIKKHFGVGD